MFGALELVQPGESVLAGEVAVRDGRAACMAAGGEATVEPGLGCNNWDAGRGEVKRDGHGHGWVVRIGFVWKNLEKRLCVCIEVEGHGRRSTAAWSGGGGGGEEPRWWGGVATMQSRIGRGRGEQYMRIV